MAEDKLYEARVGQARGGGPAKPGHARTGDG